MISVIFKFLLSVYYKTTSVSVYRHYIYNIIVFYTHKNNLTRRLFHATHISWIRDHHLFRQSDWKVAILFPCVVY